MKLIFFAGLLEICVLASATSAQCDFDQSGFCRWVNVNGSDDFNWTRKRGSTGSSGTGPSVDHTKGTSTGYYLYIETSNPRTQGQKAILKTPVMRMSLRTTCFEFWYHMYGIHIGELKVSLETLVGAVGGSKVELLWSLRGQQGNRWQKASVPIRTYSGNFSIMLEGVRGNSHEGDIAIDDTVYTISSCTLSPAAARPKDKCSQVKCPANADCFNVVSSHACRCKVGYSLTNNKCITSKVFTVKGMTLNKQWDPHLANTKSQTFVQMALKIENALLIFFKNTSLSSKILGIQVIKIQSGSIIVDYTVLVDKLQIVSNNEIQSAAVQAIADPALSSLNPDPSKRPTTSESNFCELGTHNCAANSKCVPEYGGFFCSCLSGYGRDGKQCVKLKDGISLQTIIVIAGVILITIIVIVIVVCVICMLRERRRKRNVRRRFPPIQDDTMQENTIAMQGNLTSYGNLGYIPEPPVGNLTPNYGHLGYIPKTPVGNPTPNYGHNEYIPTTPVGNLTPNYGNHEYIPTTTPVGNLTPNYGNHGYIPTMPAGNPTPNYGNHEYIPKTPVGNLTPNYGNISTKPVGACGLKANDPISLTNIYEVPQEAGIEEEPEYLEIDELDLVGHDRFEFSYDDLSHWEALAKGNFGVVHKANAKNICGNKGYSVVAVKMLKENAIRKDHEDFDAELNLMKRLKPHPHVIRLLGCITLKEPHCIILEFVPSGSLQTFLRKSRGYGTDGSNMESLHQTYLKPKQLLQFALGIADGMAHLASNNVVHRDLACRNVLVGYRLACKIADLGLARDVNDSGGLYQREKRAKLPVKWMAPESLFNGVSSIKSDVWAFGVTLWEIVTIGDSPYPQYKAKDILKLIGEHYRMEQPPHCADNLFDIMMSCWEEDPDKRPTFQELHISFKNMLDVNDENFYIDLDAYKEELYVNFDSEDEETGH